MPGSWTDLESQTAGEEELSFNISNLAANTKHDVEFSTSSDFAEDKTTAAQFTTLESVDRTLSAVTVNGDDLSGWDYTTDNTFTTSVTFSAFFGDVTVTAAASNTNATVTVTPASSTNKSNGDTITVSIVVTVSGKSRTYTLTINVISFALNNFSFLGYYLNWDATLGVFFALDETYNGTNFAPRLRVYDDTATLLHTWTGSYGNGVGWRTGGAVGSGSGCWLIMSGIRFSYSRIYHIPYSKTNGFGSLSSTYATSSDRIIRHGYLHDGKLYGYWYIGATSHGTRVWSASGSSLTRDPSSDVTFAHAPAVQGGLEGLGRVNNKWLTTQRGSNKDMLFWNADGTRSSADDFDLHSANTDAFSVASTTDKIWVGDITDRIAYAYAPDGTYLGASG